MDDDRILKVAVNDYLAAGGENLGEFFNARPSIEKQRQISYYSMPSPNIYEACPHPRSTVPPDKN